jgi:hypothetical protein
MKILENSASGYWTIFFQKENYFDKHMLICNHGYGMKKKKKTNIVLLYFGLSTRTYHKKSSDLENFPSKSSEFGPFLGENSPTKKH